jgi:signal transduction histidine kinase
MNFSCLHEILTTTHQSCTLEKGAGRLLPVLCNLFEGVAARAYLPKIDHGHAGWKPIAQWPQRDENDWTTGVNQFCKRFYTSAETSRKAITPAIHEVEGMDEAQGPPIGLLSIPIIGSKNFFLLFFIVFRKPDKRPEEILVMAESIASILRLWMEKCRAEKQYADLIDFIPSPLMMLDMDEQVTQWNPAMEKMSGVRSDQILGKGDYAHAVPFYGERRPTSSNLILHPDNRWESNYLKLRKSQDTLHALARSETLPGGPMLIASKTGVLYDLTGAPAGSVHMIQDVTHEHELQRSLHRTEKMYRSISEFAGVGIAMLGAETIHSCNENFRALLELEKTSLSVQQILDRIDPHDKKAMKSLLERFASETPPVSFGFISILPEKGRREFKGYAQRVSYRDTVATHFVIIDVTESNEMERRKQVHQMRMYHSDRLTALGTLSAGIAHELNQPLNTIRVITDGLLYGREQGWALDEAELYQNAEMISRQIMRMSTVIRNIKNFAREDKDRNLTDVDPNSAIENVFTMIGQQLIAHGIQVDKQLEPGLPSIQSQLNHLEQVVMNLVVNARQALDACEEKNKRLWIKTGRRFGQIFIEVGDNATGISKAHKKEIFDPFFTTKAVGQGTGLGLSLSQTIVSGYSGDIQAYNNAEGGATFFITIPLGEV